MGVWVYMHTGVCPRGPYPLNSFSFRVVWERMETHTRHIHHVYLEFPPALRRNSLPGLDCLPASSALILLLPVFQPTSFLSLSQICCLFSFPIPSDCVPSACPRSSQSLYISQLKCLPLREAFSLVYVPVCYLSLQ